MATNAPNAVRATPLQNLNTIGWTRRKLALATGYAETTVARWLDGRIPIPQEIEQWLQRRAQAYAEDPVPVRSTPKRIGGSLKKSQ